MPQRQTASFLMRRFQEAGIRPDTRHGQNFLIDLNLVELIAHEADVQPDEVVLEVGTGTGSLTALLAPRAAAVVTVEIDANVQQLAREELAGFDNVTMLLQDALRNKNNLHPQLLETLAERIAATHARGFKLVANLPYNIATPVVSNLLTTPIIPLSMTVTIQRELAERITAKPSTKDYSALSIWVQTLCDAEILRTMPPTVFWPRPKVESAILRIVPNAEKRARVPDVEYFHHFVRSLFLHRRKFLRSVLHHAFKPQLDKPATDAVMQEMGFGPDTRAEQLPPERILELCEVVRRRLGGSERNLTPVV